MSSDDLNARQVELLTGFANGQTPEDMAEAMGVTRSYVWQLAMQARRTLGATTTTQAACIAQALGLVQVEHGQGARLRRAREHLSAAVVLMGAT